LLRDIIAYPISAFCYTSNRKYTISEEKKKCYLEVDLLESGEKYSRTSDSSRHRNFKLSFEIGQSA